MNTLHFVLLLWAVAATSVCLFIYGAAIDDGGAKARRDKERRKAWLARMDVKHMQ